MMTGQTMSERGTKKRKRRRRRSPRRRSIWTMRKEGSERKRRSGSERGSTVTRRERLRTLILGRRWRWSRPQIGQSERAGHSQFSVELKML
ncbi:BRD9 isoform 19 [Pongo abelii]|uniref:BRD9 isoform 15 n=1 Tax=Pongo abelii TaxID=9601 RepID=A0A2J8XSG4_PONAB|nr:BRD9 isoform 2 [Pongo abelii]PNJ84979.1 BRD9 isoform 5 [Pongo abelii]PNJ84980.1 BRD9 isoform 7 [Pongo abelii]PNJ84983.1 BRD9 isoform 15 [Pongo abelii]PNJ84985.1 BRD9 isoform 19 [Pongo abelii]